MNIYKKLSLTVLLLSFLSFERADAYCSYHGNPVTEEDVKFFVESMILNMFGNTNDCSKKLRSSILNHIRDFSFDYTRYSWFIICCWDRASILRTMFKKIDDFIISKSRSYLDGSYNPSYINQLMDNFRYYLDNERTRYVDYGYEGLYYPFFGGRLKALVESVAKGNCDFLSAISRARKGYKPIQQVDKEILPQLGRVCSGKLYCDTCGRVVANCYKV